MKYVVNRKMNLLRIFAVQLLIFIIIIVIIFIISQEIHPSQTADKVLFEWNLQRDTACSVAIYSPTITTKLCTFKCALKEVNARFIDLYIQVKSNMQLTTLFTSGM